MVKRDDSMIGIALCLSLETTEPEPGEDLESGLKGTGSEPDQNRIRTG